MKKWFALLAAVMLLCSSAAAAPTQDVSTLEVSTEVDRAAPDKDAQSATLGTDVYLFVNPDTASQIRFRVTDEFDNPLQNAEIWVTVNGVKELYGVTDEKGQSSFYLFRHVQYGYEVVRRDYETAYGVFTAGDATHQVGVVLRTEYELNLYIYENGEPLPWAEVYIDGKRYVTDQDGMVQLWLFNGSYTVVILTPDGREIVARLVVDGDTISRIDVSGKGKTETDAQADTETPIDENRLGNNGWLVYDRSYLPDDYVLTCYAFSAQDVPKLPQETSEAYAARVEQYVNLHPSTLVVEAQCDHIQVEGAADRDVLDAQGEPLFAQRSLMPSGSLVYSWEGQGFDKLVFTNGDVGVMLDIDALHSGDMMKAWAILCAMTDRLVEMEDILAPQRSAEEAGLAALEAAELKLEGIDLSAIRDFEFYFDHAAEDKSLSGRDEHELISNTLYLSAQFEVRLTPIVPEALREMITEGLSADEEPADLVLANAEYFAETLRQQMAQGYLSEGEGEQLYSLMVDGRLTAEEAEALKEQHQQGTLTDAQLDWLCSAALSSPLYRASIHVLYRGLELEVTELVEGLLAIVKADELYASQAAKLAGEKLDAEALEAAAEAALVAGNAFVLADEEAIRLVDSVLLRTLAKDDPFLDVVKGKRFVQYKVDLRKEYPLAGMSMHKAYVVEQSSIGLSVQRALTAAFEDSVLMGTAQK